MTNNFVVSGWTAHGRSVALQYSSGDHQFVETLTFPVEVERTPVIDRLLDLLAIVAGVSYAKAYAPTDVSFPSIAVSEAGYSLLTHIYDHGMREFAHENNMTLPSPFTVTERARSHGHAAERTPRDPRPLIPFGGGRDSCVVAVALEHLSPTLFTVGENPYTRAIADRMKLPHTSVIREIDPALFRLNEEGAPNGHVPVTAINSLISVVLAELTGHTHVVMANEKSASQPTRVVNGLEVNHQYSKSEECEHLISDAVRDTGSTVAYGSVLRPFSDSTISRAFAHRCSNIHDLFMSCNKAMVRVVERRSDGWCKNCPKCRGVYLSLAVYLPPESMIHIFGSDMLADISQLDGFRALLSHTSKPFECVAEPEEAQESVRALHDQPEWSSHVVVRECLALAPRSTDGSDHDASCGTSPMFSAELNEFLDVQK